MRYPQEVADERIIPACAGNSIVSRHSPGQDPDHPRVCGEQRDNATDNINWFGSSPRVRGTGPRAADAPIQARIIPACAGNSRTVWTGPHNPPDHPRVCGEQCPSSALSPHVIGSSPRVRGTGKPLGGVGFGQRIIPACAGNREAGSTTLRCRSDHPRVCGEQCPCNASSPRAGGSSPRVRGTVITESHVITIQRIIPACAGNSSCH